VSDNAQVTSIADRHAGCVQCLQQHGLPVEESLVVQEGRRLGVHGVVGSAQAPGDESGDRTVLHAFLQRPDRPSAVVTTNEYVGLHVLHAAEDVGLDVSGDLAIVSCGGADISSHARVPLTSIMQPAADLGRQAAHLLLDRITGRSSAARRPAVPRSLVVPRSCGAMPRRAPLAAPSVRAWSTHRSVSPFTHRCRQLPAEREEAAAGAQPNPRDGLSLCVSAAFSGAPQYPSGYYPYGPLEMSITSGRPASSPSLCSDSWDHHN
jgi:Periplasmic binding protein-like domain